MTEHTLAADMAEFLVSVCKHSDQFWGGNRSAIAEVQYRSARSLLRRAGVDYQAQDHPVMLQEPLRDQIGRVIYECDEEQGNSDRPDWYCLSEERREPWRKDADRVILLLKDLCLLRGIS